MTVTTPSSTLTAVETSNIVSTIDPTFNGATIACSTALATVSGTVAYSYGGASKIEFQILASTVSTTTGTFTITWNEYEPQTGSVVTAIPIATITNANAATTTGIYYGSQPIGIYGFLSYTATSTSVATWNNIYVRVNARY